MTRRFTNTVIICGGQLSNLQQRDPCPNTLHDWPLPEGYVDCHEVAMARIRHRWNNRKCPDCGIYGWIPGRRHESTNAVKVEAS